MGAPPASETRTFPSLNRGYDRLFHAGRLSIGLTVPVGAYPTHDVPDLTGQIERIRAVEAAGFSAVWLRDVPFRVPSFGDAGHLTDPFVLLGLLAGQTSRIALGVASIVLPLRHPAHVAKAAASVDLLSEGRLVLGVASGDRPAEYPAMNLPFAERGARFRDGYAYIRRMGESWPTFDSPFGSPRGVDLLPKPVGPRLPLLITGASQQDADWLASHGDGWMTYPREPASQAAFVRSVRTRSRDAGHPDRPVMQPLYVDLLDDPDAPPRPMHLGVRTGVHALRDHLHALQDAGVNHVALNLRFQSGHVEHALDRLANTLLPAFPA